jgi:hypothetical protein
LATLVLSTVGTALGGPIGGAIGALVGQSFDQQLLAPAKRGPRLGDLGVQTSTYGTQIPRIYGTMRVAGSVIWATDLVESEQTTGAKGQPDLTYSYSVSLAVALSSRRVKRINRIWADGKLLRGVEGDFKVNTIFRFYERSDDQAIDPLIASIEGIANTPAYRGLAMAVFENLELADFGNRIPFMTFEVAADDGPLDVGAILSDASGGAIAGDSDQIVAGYAAYGPSIKAAVAPLVEGFGLELFDDGMMLRAPAHRDPIAIDEDRLGNDAGTERSSRIRREQLPVTQLPAILRMSYYDPDRDYQTGEARASAGDQSGNEVQQEFPGALTAGSAKSLAEQMLTRAWWQRDQMTVRLAPDQLGLEPGSRLKFAAAPEIWTAEECVVDGFVVAAKLRPAWLSGPPLGAEPGRIIANPDIVESAPSLALIDVPDLSATADTQPKMYLAASTVTPGWRRHRVEISFGGQSQTTLGPRRKSFLGRAATILNPSSCELLDFANSVEVELIDADQWLTGCDDDALSAGANLALLGRELIQFGSAEATGPGRFRLSRLLRGRGGSEWAADAHRIDEIFCLLIRDTLQAIDLPDYARGAMVSASATGSEAFELVYGAESLRPPAPVRLSATGQSNGDLAIAWVRRSRRGWSWCDEVDAPLGERSELYDVLLTGPIDSIEFSSSIPSLIAPAAAVARLGAGQLSIKVRQVGDFGRSRPAQLNISL